MIWTLVKGHLKKDRIKIPPLNIKNIFGFITGLILLSTLLGIIGFIIYLVTTRFISLRLGDVYLTFIFFILLAVLVIYEIFLIIKELYMSKDNELYFKLPIKKESIFLSKVIYIYIKQLLVTIVFLAITAGMYGYLNPEINPPYFIRLFIIALILPLVSLAFSSLISIPVSYILKWIKQKKTLLLLSMFLIIGIFFIVYIQFIDTILNLIRLTSGNNFIDADTLNKIKASVDNLNLSQLFYKMLIYSNFWMNLLILLCMTLVLASVAYILLKKYYFTLVNNQTHSASYTIKPTQKAKSPLVSIISKEYKMLTRNPNNAFQAIILNVLMPLFVVLTVKLTSQVGVAEVGNKILAGIALLTMLVFILLSNSFQGQLVSREKESYYISRILPLSLFKQLLVRMSLGLMISTFVVIVTSVLLVALGYVLVIEGVLIGIIGILFLIGYVSFLVGSDYQNPKTSSYSSGLEEGTHIFVVLFFGLFLAILMGIFLSIFAYFPHIIAVEFIYLISFGISLMYALSGLLRLKWVVMKR